MRKSRRPGQEGGLSIGQLEWVMALCERRNSLFTPADKVIYLLKSNNIWNKNNTFIVFKNVNIRTEFHIFYQYLICFVQRDYR